VKPPGYDIGAGALGALSGEPARLDLDLDSGVILSHPYTTTVTGNHRCYDDPDMRRKAGGYQGDQSPVCKM
jgi:hypothetical protein